MSAAATRGDIYLSLATFIDYFNANARTDPSVLDTSIVSCANRIGGGDKESLLCTLFPDLCD